jgi:mannitol-1-phosphate/altronate dehydrogenase
LSNRSLWHQDLTKVEGLEESVLQNLTSIVEKGVRATVNTL